MCAALSTNQDLKPLLSIKKMCGPEILLQSDFTLLAFGNHKRFLNFCSCNKNFVPFLLAFRDKK